METQTGSKQRNEQPTPPRGTSPLLKLGKRRGRPPKRTRTKRPYPAGPFEEALELGQAIHKHAAGEKVRRLTLLRKMNISPTSSSTQMLITNSNKYYITQGSYAAEWLELTENGRVATSADSSPRERLAARFKLAIEGIAPFKALYDGYKGKRIPTHEVLKDYLGDKNLDVQDLDECIDLFIVNAKFLDLLQTVAGSQILIPIEQAIDELSEGGTPSLAAQQPPAADGEVKMGATDWTTVCFYVTPIGEEGTEERKHSDLFLNSIMEPALKDLGLRVVRADKIGAPGMITSQILEHILNAKLVIVDLSFHNPSVFYELAVRHATQLAVVHVIRKKDKIPFDVNPFRAIEVDTTDIYSLVPQLETIRSQIATFVRNALADPASVKNPLTLFCPGIKITLPEHVKNPLRSSAP